MRRQFAYLIERLVPFIFALFIEHTMLLWFWHLCILKYIIMIRCNCCLYWWLIYYLLHKYGSVFVMLVCLKRFDVDLGWISRINSLQVHARICPYVNINMSICSYSCEMKTLLLRKNDLIGQLYCMKRKLGVDYNTLYVRYESVHILSLMRMHLDKEIYCSGWTSHLWCRKCGEMSRTYFLWH